MKALVVLALTVVSTSAYARPASKAERLLLCHSVSEKLEKSFADMALDERKCPKNQFISAKLVQEGVITISGKLEFNAPNRPSFEMDCVVAYDGSDVIEDTLSCNP